MSISEEKIAGFVKERDRLLNQYRAIEKQARGTLNDAERIRLKQQIEDLDFEECYKALSGKIERLRRGESLVTTPEELGRFKAELRRDWEAKLHLLNFREPESVFSELVRTKGHEAVLLLIERSNRMKADSFIKRLKKVLELDGPVRPFPEDFTGDGMDGTVIEERPFIQRWCDSLKIEPAGDSFSDRIEQVVQNLGQAVTSEQTLCLEIKVKAISYSFLKWFLKDFWNPLADRKGIRVLVVLAAEGCLLDDCPRDETCCSKDDFDHRRCLEMELHNWDQSDIERWMRRYVNAPLENDSLPSPPISPLACQVVQDTDGVPMHAHNYILCDTSTQVVDYVKRRQHARN